MSISTVVNKIQDTVAGSTLIVTTPHLGAWPPSLNAADLPLALTTPAAGTWPHDAIADIRQHRTYETRIYVMPVAKGAYHEGIEDTVAIIQAVGAILAADFTLDATIFDSEPRDRGLVILEYADIAYRGTIFDLDVIEDVTG